MVVPMFLSILSFVLIHRES